MVTVCSLSLSQISLYQYSQKLSFPTAAGAVRPFHPGDSFGNILTRSPLDYTFSVSGIVLWLLIAILLSALASFLPARTAVREVLAYE